MLIHSTNCRGNASFATQRRVAHCASRRCAAWAAYANVFAIESFMDELALAANIDPLEFRLRHLTDERARAVLQAAAENVDWPICREASGDGEGWGMALAQYKNLQCYCAVIVKLRVDRQRRCHRI